jgi:hypothetical protein
LPKRVVDVMSCEVNRAVRLTAKTVEYISFKVPRKAGNFQADLYAPCKSQEPAMKFEEYWNGVDKEPLRMEMKPEFEHHEHAAAVQRRGTFLAKLGEKNTAPVDLKASASTHASNDDSKAEIEALTQKVE